MTKEEFIEMIDVKKGDKPLITKFRKKYRKVYKKFPKKYHWYCKKYEDSLLISIA